MQLIATHRSPNFEPRRDGALPKLVILHYTGMTDGAVALTQLTKASSKVSAHYLVEEDGRVFALVDEAHRAWHAGRSFWAAETDINSISIGIEIVNPGHEYGLRAYPPLQMQAVLELCRSIKRRHHLPASAFWGHSDVAPQRKQDPGELFDWAFLAHHGIGLWPMPEACVPQPPDTSVALRLLAEIGYECPQDEGMSGAALAALSAFQRHFRPRDFSGALDAETMGLLDAVSRLGREAARPAA